MATNYYFNNFSSFGEQTLLENLIIESIKIYGMDTYYLPRTIVNVSAEFNEQQTSTYNQAVPLEMYIKSIDGFGGEGEFLSSFGVEVREEITFSVAYRSFETEIGSPLRRDRPLEGDLVWFPLNKALFQIKYVDVRPVFYQLGALQFYDVTCELFEYSNERFNTGVPIIDSLYNNLTTSETSFVLTTEDGLTLLTEDTGLELVKEEYSVSSINTGSNNQDFANSVLDFVDFTYGDPFSESYLRTG